MKKSIFYYLMIECWFLIAGCNDSETATPDNTNKTE